jgi:hypothetical protein
LSTRFPYIRWPAVTNLTAGRDIDIQNGEGKDREGEKKCRDMKGEGEK